MKITRNNIVEIIFQTNPDLLEKITVIEMDVIVNAYFNTLEKMNKEKKPLYVTDFMEWMRQEEIIHSPSESRTRQLLEYMNSIVKPSYNEINFGTKEQPKRDWLNE